MVDVVIDKQYPAANLVPKHETGVASFLAKYPEFDGDGVTIAIFDSGVDPRSDGMKTTPNGEQKVIERYDCSGSGDVDTTTKVTASTDGHIIGLSGRTLELTDRMKNDNVNAGEYRVGLKNIYDLFPNSIAERIAVDKKHKQWDQPQLDAVAAVSRDIEAHDAKLDSATEPASLSDTLQKENLANTLDALNNLSKKYANLKPMFDCVLYRTADDDWVAVIDTTQTGNLSEALVLREYSKYYDIGSVDDHLSISINVHATGDVLEIVGMCSGHGTHVASIASGSHEDIALNGVAPAAKIVSLTIGDSRLGSMETGTALVRAMIKIMELCEAGKRVHVINMSYGEHAHFSASGRVGDLMCEVINKYGVIWMASAGNFGPALCTIGTPPDIVQPTVIGVGAYLSPEMMEVEHSSRHKLPANCYTWTSRDPCIDGGQGVTVCAPGAAIASVPEFTLAKQQLMNGTSMAAPHVAGAAALLISGLLKRGIEYSPFLFKRALWNTATSLPHIDQFAQGNGLLNVEKAFEYLVTYKDDVDAMIRYSVVNGGSAKGIHIRQADPLPKEYLVTVEPCFMDDKNVSIGKKVAFNVRCTLVASECWVKVPSFLDLSYNQRSISVFVDPSGLPTGVHTARIRGYDSKSIAKGSIFEVPITVVVPNKLDVDKSTIFTCPTQSFKHNTVARHFIVVPNKATWAVLRLHAKHTSVSIAEKFMIHTMQIFPHRFCKELETQKLLSVHSDLDATHTFKCVGNNVLEVCIAKYWSSAGDTQLEATVEFRGVLPSGSDFRVADGIQRIDVAALTNEDVTPAIQLKSAVTVLRPTEAKIKPLSRRDVVPDGRQIYQNVLLYTLQIAKAQDVSLHAPILSDVLYESEFESQFWAIFDNKKMFIGCGDAFSGGKFIKLEKGEYVIRLQVRHEKRELLEKVNEVHLVATFKLATPIAMDAFTSYKNAINGLKKPSTFVVHRNATKTLFLAPLAIEKLSKGGVPSQCSMLTGTLSLAKDEFGRKVENFPFNYILPNEGPAAKKTNGNNANVKDTKTKLEELTEGLRDLKTSAIAKLDLEKSEEVYAEVVRDHPDFMQVHMALVAKLDAASEIKLQLPFAYRAALDAISDLKPTTDKLQRIVDVCNKVITYFSVTNKGNGLLEFYGIKTDHRSDAAKLKTNNDKEKAVLVDAYANKLVALLKLRLIASVQSAASGDALKPADDLKDVQEIFTEVGKFVDLTDSKVNSLVLWHSYANKHYGRMLKVLQKMYDDKQPKAVLGELRSVADALEWTHVAKQLERYGVVAHPANYSLF